MNSKTKSSIATSRLSRLTQVFLENSLFLRKYLKRFLYRDQDIEDLIQETYIKARNVERNREIEHPKAYIFRIARNLALDELDRRSRKMTDFIEECESHRVVEPSENLEDMMQAEQSIRLYCDAVSQLPTRCREVYLLRKVHGLSHKEIATRLGISLSAVGKHLSKGVIICQRHMEMHNGSIVDFDGSLQNTQQKRS